MKQKLNYSKFLRYFVNLRDEIRRCLRKGNYSLLLDNYRKLLKIPKENIEVFLMFRGVELKGAGQSTAEP
jgi:hypothetical protein